MKVTIDDLTREELRELCKLDSILLEKPYQLSESDLEGVSEKVIWFIMESLCGYMKPYRELPDTIEEAKERLCSDTIRKFEARREKEIAHDVAMGIEVSWC